MINWNNGLDERQEGILKELLEQESKIPVQKHTLEKGGVEKSFIGVWLPKNKLVRERESGYMNYIRTEDKLLALSAFSWNWLKSEDVED